MNAIVSIMDISEMPYDILECILGNLSVQQIVPLANVCKSLSINVTTYLAARGRGTKSKEIENPVNLATHSGAVTCIPSYNTTYDVYLEVIRKESIKKKQLLIQSYPASPNFFSRETGIESLESYDPCIKQCSNAPSTIKFKKSQFILLRIDSII